MVAQTLKHFFLIIKFKKQRMDYFVSFCKVEVLTDKE